MAPATAASTTLLTDAELLDLSGEASVEDIRDLNLRAKGLASLSPWAQRLPHLTALSLSHNQLSSLQPLQSLRMLTTLNVNFNQLSSLDGIQHCSCLLHLFAANNMVRDLLPLCGLSDLRTLSMYRNAVASLDATLGVLGMLPLLHEVELGGNPCALVPEYKARMVLGLPTLQVLDGDSLMQLDNDMAEEQLQTTQGMGAGPGPAGASTAAAGAGGADLSAQRRAGVGSGADAGGAGAQVLVLDEQGPQPSAGRDMAWAIAEDARPGGSGNDVSDRKGAAWASTVTAAAAGTSKQAGPYQRPGSALMRPGTASVRPGTAAGPRPGSTIADVRPGTASQRPGTTNVRLVGNEFLNDHPVLLEYLARHVLAEGLALTQAQNPNGAGEGGGMVSRLRCSFVSRLRDTAAVNLAAEALHPRDIAASGQQVVAGLSAPDARQAALETLVLEASPHETTRQLVRLCEVLIKEVEAARQQRPGSSGPGRPGTASSTATSPCPTPPRPGSGSGPAPASSTVKPGTGSGSGAGAGTGALSRAQAGPVSASAGAAGAAGTAGAASPSRPPLAQRITNGTAHGTSTPTAGPRAASAGVTSLGPATAPIGAGPGQGAGPGPGPLSGSGLGSGTGNGADGEVERLRAEVARLTREVKHLQLENQNVYWLAEQYKTMKAELQRLQQGPQGVGGPG